MLGLTCEYDVSACLLYETRDPLSDDDLMSQRTTRSLLMSGSPSGYIDS